jgi:oxygen-independent coproporphyrinogen-3 oxidase
LRKKDDLLSALHKELLLQKTYLEGEKIETIYFGGGTPSILDTAEIANLLSQIYTLHNVSENAEITIEANPDDLTAQKLK